MRQQHTSGTHSRRTPAASQTVQRYAPVRARPRAAARAQDNGSRQELGSGWPGWPGPQAHRRAGRSGAGSGSGCTQGAARGAGAVRAQSWHPGGGWGAGARAQGACTRRPAPSLTAPVRALLQRHIPPPSALRSAAPCDAAPAGARAVAVRPTQQGQRGGSRKDRCLVAGGDVGASHDHVVLAIVAGRGEVVVCSVGRAQRAQQR